MTSIIKGYYTDAGGCLVTINDAVLALPVIDRQTERRHSPEGFQWGYGGSGPAELARAILLACLPDEKLVRHPRCYQTFKRDVIAELPKSDFTMFSTDVTAWLTGWKEANGL